MSGGYIGRKFDEKKARKVVGQLAGVLEAGERIQALLWANEVSPAASTLVVTSARILKVAEIGKVVRSRRREEINEVAVVKGAWTVQVVVRTDAGREDWGTPHPKERDETHIELQAWWVGPEEGLEGAGDEEKRAADGALLDRLLAEARGHMTETGGLSLDPEVREHIEAACPPGQRPEVVVSEGDGRRGALVGFSDRLAVIGSMLGVRPFLAGVLRYSETKDITYDPGKDTVSVVPFKGPTLRFLLSSDGYTAAREQLDQLRSRVGTPAPVSPPAPPPSAGVDLGDLADDLARLAQLHASGALNDAEFAAAKRSLLGT